MQQHNLSGASDLISNRSRSRSNDARTTPPHTETSKFSHIDSIIRNEKNQRHIGNVEQQLKHLSNKNIISSTTNNNNNNNNAKDMPVSNSLFAKYKKKV